MKLEILSFEWKLFKSEKVISVNCMTKVWEITILDNQSEIPLISTDIPFGFAKDGEQIFTENFTYQMNKALKLIDEGLQL